MTHPFGYIGIDFGTSNSHFAFCNNTSKPSPEAVGVGKSGSMPTCVLWQEPAEEEEHILSYGLRAQNEWIRLDAEERSRTRFAFGFKPDLVHSPRARLEAWAFLLRAYADLSQAGLARPIGSQGYSVVIGVPAEISPQHRQLTQEIAAKAGFGAVECVDEPLGALAFHLQNGDLSPTEAREGVMVIDFGGGTFDVALVNTGKKEVKEKWGDSQLGGRLFDDLFLQWVMDQNPGLKVSEKEALVIWQNECRRLKEEFSDHWNEALKNQAPLGAFKGRIEVEERWVYLRNATVEEFERRARAYRPSLVVRKYLRGLDTLPCGLVLDQEINLFDWIRQQLCRGGSSPGQPQGQFSVVILTGGSCKWPFMKPLVAEALGAKRVIMSQNPEATIGAGLALHHVLKLRNDDRRRQIENRKPQAKIDFEKAVLARLDRYAEELSGTLTNAIMPRVEEVYWDWYNEGGSLNQVEIRVKEICKKFEETEAAGIVKRHWVPLNTDLMRLMRDHLAKFLQENEIPQSASTYIPESTTSLQELQAGASGAGGRIATEVGDMAAVAAVISTIALLIMAAVKAKVVASVFAVAMAHPALAVALGILALIGIGAAQEAIENQIKSHEFNFVTRRLLYVGLWENTFRNKLAEGRGEAKLKLQEAIRKSTSEIDKTAVAKLPPGLRPKKPIKQQALEAFDQIIDVVIQDLGVLG